ncbi:MAG: Hsp20/alpha crystallin family protein [Oscillospiraceae bacterium]|nr:Hsp20/alpha crystallin family protein [Oscillospiraceae bacterium]
MFELMPFERRRDTAMLNRYFDDFEKSFFSNAVNDFKTDIRDNGDTYAIEAELPGFNKEDINIDVKNDVLTISAQHTEDKKEEKDSYVRRERSYGAYSRSFDVTGIDTDAIKAAYKNGILELTLPKQAALPETNKKIGIE